MRRSAKELLDPGKSDDDLSEVIDDAMREVAKQPPHKKRMRGLRREIKEEWRAMPKRERWQRWLRRRQRRKALTTAPTSRLAWGGPAA